MSSNMCVSPFGSFPSNPLHAFSQILLLNDGMRGLKASSGEQLEPSCTPAFVQLVIEAAHCYVSIGCHQGERCNDQSVKLLI